MIQELADALRGELVKVLPEIPSRCADPQCGDSTWDHDCTLGPDQPNVPLADRIIAVLSEHMLARFREMPVNLDGLSAEQAHRLGGATMVLMSDAAERALRRVLEAMTAEHVVVDAARAVRDVTYRGKQIPPAHAGYLAGAALNAAAEHLRGWLAETSESGHGSDHA